MTALEDIKKALESVTPERLRYEADAMFAAVQGEQYGDTFHAYNWDDKPHRVLYDAIGLMREAASTLESLQRENEELRRAQPYTYIGRDGKSVLARDLEDRAEAAEAGLTQLREAVGELLDQAEHVCIGAHTPANIKEAARNLATPIKNVHTALASTGGEHHGN